MPALRLMTFNVQMLPLGAMLLTGKTNNAEERADTVARAILSLPADEQPDVIVFNEVFDEDGRQRLIDRLTGYPNRMEKMDSTFYLEDSGLMLFSKHELVGMPCGERALERIYDASAGDDSHAAKGVCVVQINQPTDAVTIAFTHLQAAYESDDKHSDVREAQVLSVIGAIAAALNETHSERWRNVIFVGDLNIRGDRGASTNEWSAVFEHGPLGAIFADGWRQWMASPDGARKDDGVTNIDFEDGVMRRLDYQCFRHPAIPADLVPHHMQIRLRDQSDHFALESYICRNFAHCSPATAFVHSNLPSTGSPELKRIQLNFVDRDGYQWVYVDTPGTYSIFCAPDLSVRLYLDDDLSHPISPAGTLDTNDLPGALPASVEGLGHDGGTFAMRRPFFIAVRNQPNGIQYPSIAVYRHIGDSPERAIVLTPHTDTDTGFPYGQPLGADDICWFRAFLPKTFNNALRTETFMLRKPHSAYAAFTLKDSALQDVTTAEGDSEIRLDLVRRTQGGESVYFTLARGSTDDVDFSIRWTSPISYIALDLPTGFFITDESGPDVIGADEISLQITVDGGQLFNSYWDDADTGERWPGFAEALRGRLQQVMPGFRRLPLVQDITLAYREDDFGASGSLVEIVAALGPNDGDLVPRVVEMPIPDTLGGGKYRFYCSLSRFPE